MLILAHAGRPVAPHDAWTAWNLDPLLLFGLLLAVVAYRRGYASGPRRRVDRRRAAAFGGGMLAVAVAVITPLDAVSGALASAHMVQHILLILVAAPLLAMSAPAATLLRGMPLAVRQQATGARRRLGLNSGHFRLLRHPVTVWVLHVAVLWFWHAALPYDLALRLPLVHSAEHTLFLVTGVLFWRVLVGGRTAIRVSPGLGVMLVFAMGMQSVFLSLLLTFAETSWYAGYATSTAAWGLTPLADQQLAGVVMWVPAGAIYIAAGLALLASWIRSSETDAARPLTGRPGRIVP